VDIGALLYTHISGEGRVRRVMTAVSPTVVRAVVWGMLLFSLRHIGGIYPHPGRGMGGSVLAVLSSGAGSD
jgi:hypothetical protein